MSSLALFKDKNPWAFSPIDVDNMLHIKKTLLVFINEDMNEKQKKQYRRCQRRDGWIAKRDKNIDDYAVAFI